MSTRALKFERLDKPGTFLTKQQIAQMFYSLYNHGLTLQQVADVYGVSTGTVCGYLREFGYQRRDLSTAIKGQNTVMFKGKTYIKR